jgi:hypothetical protein
MAATSPAMTIIKKEKAPERELRGFVFPTV